MSAMEYALYTKACKQCNQSISKVFGGNAQITQG